MPRVMITFNDPPAHCTTAKPKVECDFAGSVAAFGSSSTLARQTELFLGVRIAVEPRSARRLLLSKLHRNEGNKWWRSHCHWRKHRASFGDNRRVADISRRRCARGDGSLGVGGRHALARAAGLSAGWEGVPDLGTGSVSIQPDALRGSTPPAASDTNLGTAEMPFKTIGRAAELLEPGERVLVASGVYREWVRPARGGTDPEHIISYEAAPGADVVVKGSESSAEIRGFEAVGARSRARESEDVRARVDPDDPPAAFAVSGLQSVRNLQLSHGG